jgi:phospholipid/cholesterol/gamma-HCH transport system ATP-binding protein
LNWNEVPIILDDVSLHDGLDPIVESISLEFKPSAVTVLMGGSGSGKSTLLKIAAGLTPISSGQVLYGEKSLYKLNQKEYARMQQHTGFMFQDGALWANMNIQQNLTLPLVISDPSSAALDVERKVRDSLIEFNMISEMNSRPATLSAGERKIISYLRAVISNPDILFFDEPTSFIDRKGALQLIKALFKFKKEGKTILVVTHDLTLAKSLGDYIVFMNDRKVELYDSIDACMKSENVNWLNFIEDRSTDQKESVDLNTETHHSLVQEE